MKLIRTRPRLLAVYEIARLLAYLCLVFLPAGAGIWYIARAFLGEPPFYAIIGMLAIYVSFIFSSVIKLPKPMI